LEHLQGVCSKAPLESMLDSASELAWSLVQPDFVI
jgi:hypothetical protein